MIIFGYEVKFSIAKVQLDPIARVVAIVAKETKNVPAGYKIEKIKVIRNNPEVKKILVDGNIIIIICKNYSTWIL